MNPALRTALIVIGIVAAGVAAYSVGRLLAPQPEPVGTSLSNPIDVSGLELVAAGNRAVSLADFGNDVTAIFFGYTRCPDVCPLTMSRLADSYRDLGEPDGLSVVMITVDPGFDTADVTDEFARVFHEDFIGLSGTNQQVAEAASAFYVGFNDIGTEVVHTDAVMLLDRQGRFRMLYTTDRLPALTGDLQAILADRNW